MNVQLDFPTESALAQAEPMIRWLTSGNYLKKTQKAVEIYPHDLFKLELFLATLSRFVAPVDFERIVVSYDNPTIKR